MNYVILWLNNVKPDMAGSTGFPLVGRRWLSLSRRSPPILQDFRTRMVQKLLQKGEKLEERVYDQLRQSQRIQGWCVRFSNIHLLPVFLTAEQLTLLRLNIPIGPDCNYFTTLISTFTTPLLRLSI